MPHRVTARLVTWLLAGSLLGCPGPRVAIAGTIASSEASVDYIRDALGTDTLWLRRRVNTCPIVYVEGEDRLLEVAFEPSRLFRVPASLPVHVRSVKGDSESGFKIHLGSRRFGRGTLHIRRPLSGALSTAELDTLLAAVFRSASAGAADHPIIGNRSSLVAHAASCNHLPAPVDREAFASTEQALAAGFEPCPVCFSNTLRISGFRMEQRLGQEVARLLRSGYSFAPDAAVQSRLSRAGESVLERWIAPLKGYRYRFAVVESDDLNAVACPGGTIYFTSAMMRVLESEEELEAALAHEIAHVELRHGYRQYRSAMKGRLIAGLAALAAGAVAADRTHDAVFGARVAGWVATLGEIASQIVLAGYSREHEAEADDFAMTFLLRKSDAQSTAPLVSVLSKLRYAAATDGEIWAHQTAFATHPDIETRISRTGGAELAEFDSSATFWGCDASGEILLVVRLVSQGIASYREHYVLSGKGMRGGGQPAMRSSRVVVRTKSRMEYRLFASIESTTELADRASLGTLEIRAGGREYFLSNPERTEIFPVDEVSAVFVSRDIDSLIEDPLEEIRLPQIRGVTRWVPARDMESQRDLQGPAGGDAPAEADPRGRGGKRSR